ncbi:hypothetical protein L6R50_14810 [Myxococcota bacterium]|nr:hypothetical protein [Myxococcota bacterium]
MTWSLDLSQSPGPQGALHLLRGLFAADVRYLRTHPGAQHLYRAGVRYRRERGEVWRDYGRILAAGAGDCEDLACACAALLVVRGPGVLPPGAWVSDAPERTDGQRAPMRWRRGGAELRDQLEEPVRARPALLRWAGVRESADRPPGDQYHVIVVIELPEGGRAAWDPSRDLGMRGDA